MDISVCFFTFEQLDFLTNYYYLQNEFIITIRSGKNYSMEWGPLAVVSRVRQNNDVVFSGF